MKACEAKHLGIEKLAVILRSYGQIALVGPPGTGKTYAARRLAGFMLGRPAADEEAHYPQEAENGAWAMVTLAGNEDLFFGRRTWMRSDGEGEYATTGWLLTSLIRDMLKTALANPHKDYCIILDDIDAGKATGIFGEVEYALQYRGCTVDTLYFEGTGAKVTVPKNFYVIGTVTGNGAVCRDYRLMLARIFPIVFFRTSRKALEEYYENRDPLLRGKALRLFDSVQKVLNKYFGHDARAASMTGMGHTYFMAESLEQLKNAFCYRIYPCLTGLLFDGHFEYNMEAIEESNLVDGNCPEEIFERETLLVNI